MTLGERIKKVRKTLDLTQQEFGMRIGIKSNSISLIESGNRNASEQVILSICREFNVNETWLRTGEGEMFVKYPNTALEELAVDFYLDAFDEALVDEYIHLTPDQRKTFRTFFYRVLVKSVGEAGQDELLQTEMRNYPTTRIRDDSRQKQVEKEKAEKKKMPIPGGEDGLEAEKKELKEYLDGMDPVQLQMYFDQMRRMKEQQKEALPLSAPAEADRIAPEFGPLNPT